MIKKPKVSIITISYNSAATIEKTIQSVEEQTYQNIEYIVVDGNSKDGSEEIFNKYDSIIDILLKENDQGIYDAMNKGIIRASGEIIGFINSDDFLSSPEIIKKIAHEFSFHNPDMVYGDKKYVDRINTEITKRIWKAGKFKISNLKYGWMPPHLSTYVKREIFMKNGLYRTDMMIASDYEFFIRSILNNDLNIRYLPEIIAVMREGGISNKSLKNRLISLKEVYTSWKLNGKNVSPFIMLFKPLFKIPQYFRR